MRSSKSPESKEVTPSKKKLTQARLPFKLISDVSPKPAQQQTRKRKLSTTTPEPVTKIGKISKENGLADDPVVISDDECVKVAPQKEEKIMNPFVKLVDTAWKKKTQKAKKKKNSKKRLSKVANDDVVSSVESMESECDELMEFDTPGCDEIIEQTTDNQHSNTNPEKDIQESESVQEKLPGNTSLNNKISEIVVLEESNDSIVNNLHEIKTNAETETEILDTDIKSTESDKINTQSNKESDEINIDKKKSEEISNKDEKTEASADENEETDTAPINKLTPKRSARNKTRLDEKNLNTSNSKLDESVTSNPSTPKRSRDSSASNSVGNDSMNESTTNLTPKQLQKKLESAKKREEKEKDKQEREKKRQQEKEERAKLRQEKEEQKKKEREEKEEAKKKEKEEKEEQKRKEREEKERQKELEKKLKEEKEDLKRKEREEKEEQRKKEKEAKEEEKRKRHEALELEKQEQEFKKKKAAEAFVNFFVPKQKVDKDQVADGPISKNSMLSSFTIKVDMRLAPTIRVNLSEDKRQGLDDLMEQQNNGISYLKNLRERSIKPMSSGRTWPLEDKDDDVMIVEDELPPIDGGGEIVTCCSAIPEKHRPKLLSFHENRRPPYWGTWRKKSAFVKPRKPFGQDEKQLDYEADSDEEWEEEQEGESIDGSAAGSDDEQDADEYEVDNEVFVPHGYLSDEEATMDEDDVLSLSPETQKIRLKHLEDEFESEMKKPTEKLKPRVYGLLWENSNGGRPEHCVDALWNYFGKLAMIMDDPTPLLQPSQEPDEPEKKKVKKKKVVQDGDKESPKIEKKKKSKGEKQEIKPKAEAKKTTSEVKNQPGINTFLKKIKTS